MKTKFFLIPILLILVVSLYAVVIKNVNNVGENLNILSAQKPIVFAELFTSEGCSSCPPADELLIKKLEENKNQDYRLVAISWHVDYWNRLGWKDQFSKKEFTKRQYDYSERVSNGRVYTPQIIFNGKKEFLGSDYKSYETSKAEKVSNKIEILLKKSSDGNKNISIDYEIGNQSEKLKNQLLTICLVKKDGFSNVKSGENQGRKLYHKNIVSDFRMVELNQNKIGKVDFPFESNKNLNDYYIVGFTQSNLKSIDNCALTGIYLLDNLK